MASTPSTAAKKPPRRTQEERRETTRAALLDATIDCLVEYGYADTTTTRVVERAGVSRGAQVHHFPTKAALVAEAVRRLAQRRIDEIRRETDHLPGERGRTEAMVDILWRTHSGPLFAASLELWVAARTDAELRASLMPVEREVIDMIRGVVADALGDEAPSAEVLSTTVTIAITLILGLGMQTALLSNKRAADAAWKAVRPQLLALLDGNG